MHQYSKSSLSKLATCDHRIVRIFSSVIQVVDYTIVYGKRTEEEQNKLFADGLSQLQYPDSYHNKEPLSKAIDAVPYPIDWDDRERLSYCAGIVKGIAVSMGYKLTWGGDWNNNFQVSDNKFDDLAHFQIED